jgi:hypothetical protein
METPMALPEPKEGRKWVRDGHCIYTNLWLYYYESGQEMNFLDASRCELEEPEGDE